MIWYQTFDLQIAIIMLYYLRYRMKKKRMKTGNAKEKEKEIIP